MFSVVLVFSMLSLDCIVISDLVVANLLIYSLPDMILLYLATPFYTEDVFGMSKSLRIKFKENQLSSL